MAKRPSALVVAVGLVASVLLYLGFRAWRAAASAADYSCLASLHASLDRRGVFDRAPGGQDWRQWTDAEVAAAISVAQPSDCADRVWWKEDVGIRTRHVQVGAIESYVWRKSDPRVSSSAMGPSNDELQRTRPAQATEPRR
jgi:hypothetical protein